MSNEVMCHVCNGSGIGAMGGKLGRTGGFYANRELARTAGAKGGMISRRTKKS